MTFRILKKNDFVSLSIVMTGLLLAYAGSGFASFWGGCGILVAILGIVSSRRITKRPERHGFDLLDQISALLAASGVLIALTGIKWSRPVHPNIGYLLFMAGMLTIFARRMK